MSLQGTQNNSTKTISHGWAHDLLKTKSIHRWKSVVFSPGQTESLNTLINFMSNWNGFLLATDTLETIYGRSKTTKNEEE